MYAERMTEEITLDGEEDELDDPNPAPDDESEPDVEIEDDEPEPAPLEPDYSHDEPEPEPKAEEPDALADLQKQLADMASENERLRQGAARSEETELQSQQALIATGLARARGGLAAAKEAYKTHAAAGDWDKATAAQEAMQAALLDVREFEQAGDEIKQVIEDHKRRPRVVAPAANADPFEASIATMSDASKTWCRNNKADLTKSPTRGNMALLGHQMAIEEGLKADTPEYFAFLDKHMGYEPKMTTKTTTTTRTPKPTGKPRVAAPAGSRVAPANGGATEIKLSRAEIATAQAMGMSVKDYAKNKAEIIKNGRDHTRSGPRYSNETAANRR
jgi:hypothetical protein